MNGAPYPSLELRPADWKEKAFKVTIFLFVATIFSLIFQAQPNKNFTLPLIGWNMEGVVDLLSAAGLILFPLAIIFLWLAQWSGTQRVTVDGALLKVENRYVFFNYTKEFEWQQVHKLEVTARHAPTSAFSDGNYIQLSFDYGRDRYKVLTGIDYALANDFLAEIQRQFPRV